MGLSSNILWHQTTEDSLNKILESKRFLCAYSVEDVADMAGQNYAFPMVSMCDLPLSELTEFLGKYHSYCIGMSREWGVRNRFTPIWYYEAKSRVPKILKNAIEDVLNKSDDNILSLMGILSYMKKVEGPLPKHNYEVYRFYDEREVRHVPSFDYVVAGKNEPILTEEGYAEYKAKTGSPVINSYVKFEWSDVRYIIVKEKAEVDVMIAFLESLGCDNHHIGVFYEDEIIQDVIGYKHNEALRSPTKPHVAKSPDTKLIKLFKDKLSDLYDL